MALNHNRQPLNFLSGWKDIATYMGKGVRTVQRYEHQLGLPVRRPAGKAHAAVIATKAEIDAWVEASPIQPAFPLLQSRKDSQLLVNVRGNIAEMHQLREQTAVLRADFREALHQLKQTVLGLKGQTHPDELQETLRGKPHLKN